MQNVKEWMDRIVAVEKERRNLLGFNDAISICSAGEWITFFQGLEIVADELGLEIKEGFLQVKMFLCTQLSMAGLRLFNRRKQRCVDFANII